MNGFVREIVAGKVPGFLSNAVAYELDTASLGGDAQYKGEVEDRFKGVIDEVEGLGNAVLVIESVDKLFDKLGSAAPPFSRTNSARAVCNCWPLPASTAIPRT